MGIEIIGKLTQKNNGDFKLVDLENVDYDGTGKNAKQELEKKIEEAKNSSTPYDDTAIKSNIQTLKDNQINLVEDDTSMEGISDAKHDTLNTTNKTLIGAINEVNSQFKDIAKKIEDGNIGNNVEPELMDMPRIYFSEGTLPTTKTSTMMKFDYYSKTTEYHGWVEIKCQGNSSMGYPKKNFTIKLYKDKAKTEKLKIDFKGWGKQSKFVLKANWIDLTHARNVVSARIWGDIVKSRSGYTNLPELLRTSPNQGAVDGFPVTIYGNGYYQGRYTLNIPKDKWMSNMDDTLDTHCILCGENYYSGCFLQSANIDGSDWTDELHDIVPNNIKTRWNEVITFVKDSTDVDFKANLNNYIDVESAIDYLLYGLISTGFDAFGKNQIYMTYDGVKWIASMYDMDSTWGLWWNGSKFVATDYAREQFQDMIKASDCTGEGNKLYVRLQNLFINEIRARYAELRQTIFTYPYLVNKFEEFTQICPQDIVQEDYASTTANNTHTGIPSKTTNNIQQLRSYINARLTYVDSYINSSVESAPCTAISLNKTELIITSPYIPDEVVDVTKNTSKGSLNRGKWLLDQGHAFGDVTTNDTDTSTDFIPFTSNNTLTISQPTSQYGCGAVAYDSNKKAISCYTSTNTWDIGTTANSVDSTNTSVNIKNPPENTAYIRLCFNLTDLSNVVVTKKYSNSSTSPEKLIATVTPTNTTDKIIWSVSPSGIVTVENGIITPVSNGECIITATCGSQSAICNINVNVDLSVKGLALNKKSTNLTISTVDESNLNLASETTYTGDTDFISDEITLQKGIYEIRNIGNGAFTWLGFYIKNGDNWIKGLNGENTTNSCKIYITKDNFKVKIKGFKSANNVVSSENLGLFKVNNLTIDSVSAFTHLTSGSLSNPGTGDTQECSNIVNLDSTKSYILRAKNYITDGSFNIKVNNVTNYYWNNLYEFSPLIPIIQNATSVQISCATIPGLSNIELLEVSLQDVGNKIIYETDTLTATLTPTNTTNKAVTWTSNNENVELVPNGLDCTVKAKIVGNSIITCTSQDTTNGTISDTCNVTVS